MGMIYTATAPIGKPLLMQLRELFHKDSLKYGCMFDIFMFAGPRTNEVLKMKVFQVAEVVSSHVDFVPDGYPNLREITINKYKAKEDMTIFTTKQDRAGRKTFRVTAISPILKVSIENYLNSLKEERNPDDLLFPGQGGPMAYNSISEKLKKYSDKIGLNETVIGGKVGFHSIRKSFAISLFQFFGSDYPAMLKVKRELKHKHVETTYRYVGIDPEEGAQDAIRSGAFYDVNLLDRIKGKDSGLLQWSALYDIFEPSGALETQMKSWLRTHSSDEYDIQRTFEWMQLKKQKVEYLW